MISVENEYYLRVYLLLFEGSSYITKEIIRRELPKYGGDLDALLKLKKESKLRHEFHKKQMEKLFPNGGYDKTNINTWDMQMLVGVILIIFQPTLSTREKEKLKEIKDTRNTLAHGSAVELNRKKYDEKKHQIQVAIEELASGFNDAVKTKCRKFISTYIFDPLDVSSAIKRLQELRSTDDKFQELLDLTAKSQNVIQKGISGAESNIRKDLKDLDERIKKVDEKTLQGLNELIKEVKELREQANKQKVYKDEYTQTANTEIPLQTVERLEDEIKQKINICNQNMDPDIRMSLQPSEDRMASAKDEQKGATGFDKKKRSKMHKRSPQTIKTSMKPTSVGTKPPVVHTIRGRLDAPTTSSTAYVAIDLGTSYSGYTIAVGNILYCPTFFVKLPTKTPSVILLDENKHIRSFGYEAEELYTERQEIGDHLKWYCFRRFKTIFSSKEKVTSKDELVDENGRKMKALDVFAAAIHYFRNKAMEWLRKNCGDRIMDRDVRWIFTIPSEPFAAQFMREASFEAGLHRENISVLLESESLSAYFQLGCLDDGTRFYKPGTKYMIIDIGGWTAHITVFEVDCENSPRELHKASSRVCGGIKVDEEFYQFLNGVFGELVFSRFCKELQQDYLDFQRDIEFEKRRVGSKSTKLISFRLPCGLLDILQEETGKTLKEVVEESPYRNFLSIKREKLQIESEFLESMFTNCCESIVRNISNILETSAAEGLQLLVMAGGISNSELVKEAVANAFPNLIVMVPENAETAMMSGALWSAFNPISIPIRVLPYTYGIKILPLFDPSVHSEDRRVRINGKDRCKNVFRKYAGVNEEVEKDAITCHEHTTVFPFQKEMFLEIYGTNKPNPMYVDEFDVVRLGTLSVQLCQGRQECVVNVKFVFGGTEIKIEATDLSNNRKFTTSLNYLT